MANQKQLKILKQGVKTWNRWRKENPGIVPDLRKANMQNLRLDTIPHADLSGARLSEMFWGSVDLKDANLEGADLSDGHFNMARLNGVNMNNADLTSTLFDFGSMSGATLHGATIFRTTFYDLSMSNVDFSQALIVGATFIDVDLSSVLGLESLKHEGPSNIGIDTIYKSRGKIPEKFLRECGIPESFIVQIPALIAALEPIQFYSCFISYSSKDEEFAKRLYADLQNEGVRCWFAPEDLKIGEKFRVRIDESIRLYDKLLLVLSENSVSSQWVEKEVETALEKEREQGKIVLFPVRLDEAVFETKTGWAADVKRSRHIGDFREWKNHDSYRKAFERLMRDLKAEANR